MTDVRESLKVYRVCQFERGAVVPSVELISAACDEQAIAFAHAIHPPAECEVWDMHRLVAHLPAALEEASSLVQRS